VGAINGHMYWKEVSVINVVQVVAAVLFIALPLYSCNSVLGSMIKRLVGTIR
jgi:hypothetical protein